MLCDIVYLVQLITLSIIVYVHACNITGQSNSSYEQSLSSFDDSQPCIESTSDDDQYFEPTEGDDLYFECTDGDDQYFDHTDNDDQYFERTDGDDQYFERTDGDDQYFECTDGDEHTDDDPLDFGGHEADTEGYRNSADSVTDNDPLHANDTPLYAGASITVNVTMVLLLAFATRHKLTNEAISDLLYLIHVICPKPNNTCTSLYKFRKFFSKLIIPVHFCYYCSDCFNPIINIASTVCSACEKAFSSIKDFSYFVHFSVTDQIKSLFTRKHFFSDLQHHFLRVKVHENNYEDVYDGHLYKAFMVPGGILSFKHNISLTWNVDGLPLFKSSKFSLWPLYFIINELPYKVRRLKENIIIAGLWFGESKPSMNIYLKPIVRELMLLEKHGVKVEPPMCSPFVSKVILLAGTCDLPAKCLVLNCIQFNGEFGCTKCLEPGITLTTSVRGHTHVYPYNDLYSNGHCQNRTKETYHDNSKEALSKCSIENGIKGPSWLMKLKHYDIIKGTSIDYMHCVLLGVMKLLMSLWFNTTHKHERYYIGRKVGLVDQRLSEINPPSIITRRPRGSEHFKFYKASEYRSFLLYYSLPILHDILPQVYWNHYARFVVSIYYLTQQSISDQQLDYCEQSIKQFCSQFESLYGRRYMTANIHLLLHLTECVRELGPL